MTDQTGDEYRLENEEQQDDVEGHGALAGEPALEPRLANDEPDDDVEGHMGLKGGALREPGLGG